MRIIISGDLMAKIDIQRKINKNLGYVRFSNKSGSHVNCFRASVSADFRAESEAHMDTKYRIWKALRRMGHDVIVEPIFTTGDRADVLDLTSGVIYEVVNSETDASIEKKRNKYPWPFEIRKIDAMKTFRESDIN